MAMPRELGSRSVTSSPSIEIRPEDTSSNPAIILKTVDLPQPEGPTSTVKEPLSTVKSRFGITSVEPKDLVTPEKTTALIEI